MWGFHIFHQHLCMNVESEKTWMETATYCWAKAYNPPILMFVSFEFNIHWQNKVRLYNCLHFKCYLACPLPFFVTKKYKLSLVAYQWVHIAFRESGHFGSNLLYSQHHCVCLWGSIFHLAVWQRGPNKLGRFVVVFVRKLGVRMKWRSPHTRDSECLFNLFWAYQPGHTAGDGRRGGKE